MISQFEILKLDSNRIIVYNAWQISQNLNVFNRKYSSIFVLIASFAIGFKNIVDYNLSYVLKLIHEIGCKMSKCTSGGCTL